jgi:hypothetical protein
LRDGPQTAALPLVVTSAHDRIRALTGQMKVQDPFPQPVQIDRMDATVAAVRRHVDMPDQAAPCRLVLDEQQGVGYHRPPLHDPPPSRKA